jgi:sugar phosphate isomerase/epimerase
MKLSVITDEISQDFGHALDVMLDYSVTGAELRGLWGINVGELPDDRVAEAKRLLHERGMKVSCLASPFYKCDIDEDAATVAGRMHLAEARGYSQQMDLLERLCQLAHEFETEQIRVFTFWRRGEMTPEIEQRIIDAYEAPVKIAEREGVTLVLENEHACYVGTGAEAGRVVRTINSPRVTVCWDPGNAFCAGETPFPDGWSHVADLTTHIHIKDGVKQGDDFRWTVVGDGDIDYIGHFDALRTRGYSGYISLETHYKPEGGSAEDGSRPCLAALRRFVKD